jgi:cysteine sulfinate desulfinase/cysteine desulfurase-like protein
MGLSNEIIEDTLRIGLGKFTTDDDVNRSAEILSTAAEQVRNAMGKVTSPTCQKKY